MRLESVNLYFVVIDKLIIKFNLLIYKANFYRMSSFQLKDSLIIIFFSKFSNFMDTIKSMIIVLHINQIYLVIVSFNFIYFRYFEVIRFLEERSFASDVSYSIGCRRAAAFIFDRHKYSFFFLLLTICRSVFLVLFLVLLRPTPQVQ